MIASRPDRALAALLVAALAGAAALGCRSPGAKPIGPAIDSSVRFAARVPDVADQAAAQLAEAALASDVERTQQLLERLRAIDDVLVANDERPTGLVPVAEDLANATRSSSLAYRNATRGLLESGDLDPALRERLSQARDNDPLELASARIRDAWQLSFGRAFNALAEPIGKSIVATGLAPYRLARSLLSYAIQLYNQEPLPLQRRQALAHWKEFIARYPDAREAGELQPLIEEGDIALAETLYARTLRASKRALEESQARAALVYAGRALAIKPEDPVAVALHDEAERRLERERALRSRSLDAAPAEQPLSPAAQRLAVALLEPGADVAAAANALLESDTEGSFADEARFASAIALGDAGEERAMWHALDEIAAQPTERSNMARHARAQIDDPALNPYRAFRSARNADRAVRAKWVAVGPWSRGVPKRGLPEPVEWVIGLPAIAQTMLAFPLRLIQLPWLGTLPTTRLAAVHARHYLAASADGAHAAEVRRWLSDFERERDNWIAVYNLALQDPEPDSERLGALREKAAEQASEFASREARGARRVAMYRQVAREYPDTESGKRAGMAAREAVRNATPQRIRISRGFLLENPEFAGPRGLALDPELLDENPVNGELHDAGVVLIGGRSVELSFVGPEGDGDDPPLTAQQRLSEARFARMVSMLEETSFRNALLDPDDAIDFDPNRDVVFERARVGLSDEIDVRPLAESSYSYRGMRERYGMVRARESILPFSLVLQGSLTDLSLGAFPRINAPRETPDAFLYR